MAWHRCLQNNSLQRDKLKKKYNANVKFKLNPGLISVKKAFYKTIYKIQLGLFLFISWIGFVFCLIRESFLLFPVWFYELFRFCPFKPGIAKSPFYIIGHRGAAADEIENTIPSFDLAIDKLGANALEMDISFTKDNKWFYGMIGIRTI